MNGWLTNRAVVIGGGAAGLLSARVLSKFFDRVIVCERDTLPEEPRPRRGVPQGRHVHLLLTRGIEILESLFPGLLSDLQGHGARLIDTGDALTVLNYHGWSGRYRAELQMLTCSRPLLDWCISQRIANHPRIQLLPGSRVVDLIGDAEAGRVRGVRYERGDGNARHEIPAGLVVDASGRFSLTPQWLTRMGYALPKETIVDPHLGYATRLYEGIDADRLLENRQAALILGKPPEHTRGGVLIPVEGHRWLVTLAGVARDYPPTDEGGFLAFAQSLRSDIVYSAIRDAQPVSQIFGYRSTSNRFRHYESLDRWPDGFLAIGESVCALNPIYAQGISVVAQQATLLHRWLRKSEAAVGAARRFQRDLASINRSSWLMATGEDYRWPQTEGAQPGLPIRLTHRYLDAVLAAGTENPEIDRRFAEVVHMRRSPWTLLHPRVSIRALGRMVHSASASRS